MRSSFWRGARATLPVALGVVPFGIAYGAVASQQMPLWQGWLMSLTVFAGTAQFVAASMVAQGSAYLPILVTGILLNLRLVLMSAAFAPRLKDMPRALQPIAAQLLTDESFAVSLAEFEQNGPDVPFYFGSGLCLFTIWQIATPLGMLFGANIPDGLGLDYALPATLICLLFLLVRSRRAAWIAVLSAAVGLVLRPLVSGTWSTMAATILAATLGVMWKQWRSHS